MRSGGQDFSRHPDVLEVTDEAARRPTSRPLSVSPCAPRARPAPRSAVGHPAHGAGRRGRRPLPPILPRRGARRAKDSRRPRRRAFVADEVADEAARKPASKPFSVSPCLPVLRVNRPEARSPVRSRRSAPLPVHCRTSRAEGGPPRTSAPTTHPAPTRPGARSTRAALGAGLSSGGDFTLRTVSERGAGMVKKREQA